MSMSKRLALFVALGVSVGACRCTPRITSVEDSLRVSPESLSLTPVFVGTRSGGIVTVTNTSTTSLELDISIDAPFAVDAQRITLGGAEERALEIALVPDAVASFAATLHIGKLEVPVDGAGLEIPTCPQPTAACTTVAFDLISGRCVESVAPDQTACETNCLLGTCTSGVCVGALKGCDPANACLIGTCSETSGCGVVARECPAPASACQVASCDPLTGCGLENAIDGTLCGVDDCFATQVDVCMAGQCVPRPRPTTARCSNRWVPDGFPARDDAAAAYDPVRKNLVVFGGRAFGDTWTFDGQRWEQRFPANSPPPRAMHAMTWDSKRKRVLLFGGRDFTTVYSDTWEWDGVTWVQRFPTTSPPGGSLGRQKLAYDQLRERAVLFIGERTNPQTWEWDGVNWSLRAPATSPPPDQAYTMTWDGSAQRVVLFGGLTVFSVYFNDTWEWDGTTWTKRNTPVAPSQRAFSALSWDPQRGRLVLFGGNVGTWVSETWEWDGTQWVQRTPVHAPPAIALATLVWDSARQRTVLVDPAGSSVWEWDGTDWTARPGPTRAPNRYGFTLTTDTVRNRVVLFGGNPGGSTSDNETWEWDGTWTRKMPAQVPPVRQGHAAGFDLNSQRVLMFGGIDNATGALRGDTWAWDGTTWAELQPTTSPPPSYGTMSWDPVSQRLLLFCSGSSRSDVWSWDGTTWTELIAAGPGSSRTRLTVDPAHQNLLRFDGTTSWWNAGSWAAYAPTLSPPTHLAMDLAPDPVRGRVIYSVRGQSWIDPYRTYEWDGAEWTARQLTTELPGSTGEVQLAWDPVRQRVMAVLGDTTWHLLP